MALEKYKGRCAMTNKPMPWIKFHPEQLDDIRLASLHERVQLRYYQLYLLAGRLNAGGAFLQNENQLTPAEIAYMLRTDAKQFEKDLASLKKARLIKVNGHGPYIAGFADEQINWIQKQQEERERKKKQRTSENVTRDTHGTNADVTRDAVVTTTDVPLLERERERDLDSDKTLSLLLSKTAEIFEQNQIPLNDDQRFELMHIIADVKAEWVPEAIKVARNKKKLSAAYVIGILKNFLKKWRLTHADNKPSDKQSAVKPAKIVGQSSATSAATRAAAERIVARRKAKANV